MSSRRDFLKTSGLAVAGGMMLHKGVFSASSMFSEGEYKLIPLPYAYNALEPFLDARTMEFHHSKHHAAYVNNLNKALLEKKIKGVEFEKLLGSISKYPLAIRNNAGGHYNHTLFWSMMAPNSSGKMPEPGGKLKEAIEKEFEGPDAFKKVFEENAKSVFGSGWVWLVLGKDKKLSIGTTPNQDNPIMDDVAFKGSPILCLDLWEHAYYLKYENKRTDYIAAWWNVVNWDEAERMYISVK